MPDDRFRYNMGQNSNRDDAILKSALEAFLHDQIFSSRVQSIVDARIADKVPRAADKYLDRVIPGMVSKELMDQVPRFLDQNRTMRDILDRHTFSLSNELEAKARHILARISDESQYHDVRQAYISSIDNRFNAQLAQQNASFQDNMANRLKRLDEADARISSLETWSKVHAAANVLLSGGLIYLLFHRK
jgi:hypothetical protein